jgi:hypothetical protein
MDITSGRIIRRLPHGNIGQNGLLFEGEIDGRAEHVALKVSRYTGERSKEALEKEFMTSRELSGIMPNTAAYLSMVRLDKYPDSPAFAMDIIPGYPLMNRNLDCCDPDYLRTIVTTKAVDQLSSNLEKAAKKGWHPSNLDYFILMKEAMLKERPFDRGDIVIFDFCDWYRESGREPKIDKYIKNLGRFVR